MPCMYVYLKYTYVHVYIHSTFVHIAKPLCLNPAKMCRNLLPAALAMYEPWLQILILLFRIHRPLQVDSKPFAHSVKAFDSKRPNPDLQSSLWHCKRCLQLWIYYSQIWIYYSQICQLHGLFCQVLCQLLKSQYFLRFSIDQCIGNRKNRPREIWPLHPWFESLAEFSDILCDSPKQLHGAIPCHRVSLALRRWVIATGHK